MPPKKNDMQQAALEEAKAIAVKSMKKETELLDIGAMFEEASKNDDLLTSMNSRNPQACYEITKMMLDENGHPLPEEERRALVLSPLG